MQTESDQSWSESEFSLTFALKHQPKSLKTRIPTRIGRILHSYIQVEVDERANLLTFNRFFEIIFLFYNSHALSFKKKYSNRLWSVCSIVVAPYSFIWDPNKFW